MKQTRPTSRTPNRKSHSPATRVVRRVAPRPQPTGVRTRKAVVADAPEIHRLIGVCSELGFMLPKTLGQIYETMQEWVVAEEDGRVIGCAALHVDYALLAEIRSVAVDPSQQGKGIGRMLVDAQVEEARRLGVKNTFVLTDKPGYFEKLGFREIDKADLPRKIWRDCVNCPAFPECHEVALIRPTDPNDPNPPAF